MKKKIIFVYGSLLSGLHNHGVIRDISTEFLGEWETPPEFTMVSLGSFPGVLEGGNTSIKGELYAVSEAVYAHVERLEGYPTFYDKKPLKSPLGPCEMYILPRDRYISKSEVPDGDWRRKVGGVLGRYA